MTSAEGDKFMHARMNMLAGDPAQIGEATRYTEGTVRPHVEAQHGNRGLACLINADLGLCLVVSYWDSLDALTSSEQAVQVSRKEVAERLHASVTVEQYDVPVFVRRSRPRAGAGIRIGHVECAPATIDAFIEEFRSTGVPALMEMRGLASAQLMTNRATGRCIVITAWDDEDALAASRAATARLRANASASAHVQVRGVEEYELVFSSVRDGDTRSLIERDIELWNASDREGWLGGHDLHRLEVRAPGGMRLTGRDAADVDVEFLPGGIPGQPARGRSPSTPTTAVACTRAAAPARTPESCTVRPGTPPTGQRAQVDFCGVYEFEDGKISELPPLLRPGGPASPARRRRGWLRRPG